MNSLWLVLIAAFLFVLAYKNYGEFAEDKWGINFRRPTPVHRRYLKPIYDSYSKRDLAINHAASVIGIGAVAGPAIASKFGWLPVYIWIIISCIFIGCINDFGSLFISVREDGNVISKISEKLLGKLGHKSFIILSWILSVFMLSVSINIMVNIFSKASSAFVSFAAFIITSFVYALAVKKSKLKKGILSFLSIALILVVSYVFSCILPKFTISPYILYTIIPASIFVYMYVPYWLSDEPKNKLSFFMIALFSVCAFLGILIFRPYVKITSYVFSANFSDGSKYFLPAVFLLCGSGLLSGIHSFACSGTASKQIDNESDEKCASFSGILFEGFIGILVILYASFVADKNVGPIEMFTQGFVNVLSMAGINAAFTDTFVYTVIAVIAFNSAELSISVGKYLLDNFISSIKIKPAVIFENDYISPAVTIGVSCILMIFSYEKLWMVLGIVSAMVTAFSLNVITVWFKTKGKNHYIAAVPMVISYIISAFGIVMCIMNCLMTKQYVLLIIAAAALGITVMFVVSVVTQKHVKGRSINM